MTMSPSTMILSAVLLLLASTTTLTAAQEQYKNVYGAPLQSCSHNGMALTGFTRNGSCVDQDNDAGSHHICINMRSTNGGNFCTVTGQSDWCSSEMGCHENPTQKCPVQQWCVCQWAFASYLEHAGGCDEIQDIDCNAINVQALKGYFKESKEAKYQTALNCIVKRCGVTNTGLYMV